ncbi:MAG TPA: sigma-70 family RNA polymerase sigma factor [Magnetospirillaceae bacterium]|nr:sigma-70 family RNA polymerase sigma factor [Magnetospirillaceae bacterium]
MKQSEQKIIHQILNGDENVYGVLIDRYKEGLYRHCFQFVRDEATAEDIAQEAFIHAYTHLGQYNEAYRFSTWLYKIGTNLALQFLRRKQPRLLEENEVDLVISTLPATDQLARNNEIRDAVAKLPTRLGQTINLRYFEGKTYEEIATILKTPQGTIKARVHRAKKQLKEMLS